MAKKICTDYKRYGFCDNVPYVSSCQNIKDYLDNKFEGVNNTEIVEKTVTETIDKSMGKLQCKMNVIEEDIHHVCEHVCHAEDHIIHEIHKHANTGCCNGVSKKDLKEVVDKVNQHIDDKFNEVDFTQQFSDLNKQVADIYGKVNKD